MPLLGNRKDLSGKKFGLLSIIKDVGRNKHGKVLWECICDCGNKTKCVSSNLINGDTKSCGCIGRSHLGKSRLKHGLSHKNNTEYEIWKGMKARCGNPNNSAYKHYGGRGILVCDRWKNSFDFFILDMGKRPSNNHSLDRFPNTNGNYEPSNCRWATNLEQSRNKRSNRWFTYEDKNMVLQDWATYFKVDQSTLVEHLRTKTFEQVFIFYKNKKLKLGQGKDVVKETLLSNPELVEIVEKQILEKIAN